MHRVDAPALRGTWLGRLLHLLNPLMRALLASRAHWPLSRWFVLLVWKGPRTGQPRSIPVSYVREGNRLWLTTGDTWWQNVVRSPDVTVRLRGQSRPAMLTPIEGEASRDDHARLFRRHRWFRMLAGVPAGQHGSPDMDALSRSIHNGRTLIRVDLELG